MIIPHVYPISIRSVITPGDAIALRILTPINVIFATIVQAPFNMSHHEDFFQLTILFFRLWNERHNVHATWYVFQTSPPTKVDRFGFVKTVFQKKIIVVAAFRHVSFGLALYIRMIVLRVNRCLFQKTPGIFAC